MAIISKSTLFQIFWIFFAYSSVTVALLMIYGPSFLVMPTIREYSVNVNHFNITQLSGHRPTQIYQRHHEHEDTRNTNDNSDENSESRSDEQWKPAQINASYVSVPDEQALNFHCNVCAVVTNSGQLLGKGAGFEIDQSDCIFRMNTAPFRGFEKDVGSRTDVRIIGHSNLIKDDLKNDLSLIPNGLFSTSTRGNQSLVLVPWLFHKELNKTEDQSYLMAQKLSERYPDVKFYVSTPEWVAVAEKLFKIETGITRAQANTWLSTGWMAILFAIESCETVDVYGMVHEQHCMEKLTTDAPYHYYENGINDTKECQYYLRSEGSLRSGHKLMTEKAVFARWSKRHDLNFYYPTWENVSVTDSSTQLETLFLQLYKDEPLRQRLQRRKKMFELREKFKKRYAKKRVKIVYKHGNKGRLIMKHRKI